jgi:hypothetical protein
MPTCTASRPPPTSSRVAPADLVFPLPAAKTGRVRRRAPRWLTLLAVGLLGLLGALADPTPAFACECTPITHSRAARQADAIFRGTVVAVRDVGRGEDARTDIRFEVDAVYKGAVYRDQLVASPRDEADCGLTPRMGSTWVIFAIEGIQGSSDDAVLRLITDTCRGNVPTDRPPTMLGRPHDPIPGASDREERATGADRALTRGLAIGGIGLLFLAAVAVAGLAVLWRPGRSG